MHIDRFGVTEHAFQCSGARFGHCAQAFLIDRSGPRLCCRQSDCCRWWHQRTRRSAPPGDPFQQLLTDSLGAGPSGGDARRHRSPGFRRGSPCPASSDQTIDCGTDHRIGGDAGVAVRAAAFQPDDQVADRYWHPLDLVGGGSSSPSAATPASMVARVPPLSWMVSIGTGLPSSKPPCSTR